MQGNYRAWYFINVLVTEYIYIYDIELKINVSISISVITQLKVYLSIIIFICTA